MVYSQCGLSSVVCQAECSVVQAKGEAEADLAFLSRVGKIGAVLTEDSDALLFGAERVLRL